jgi:hypothetical protein
MKTVLGILVASTMVLLSASAAADPTTSAPAVAVVHTLNPIIIVGRRPNKPSVVIELTRPTAANAAHAAHEEMRNAWLEASVPATMKSE